MLPTRLTGQGPGAAPVVSDQVLFETVKDALLPGNQVNTGDTFEEVMTNVLNGNTAIIIDGVSRALFVESKGWEHRGVERPQTEAVIRGPQEAFTEIIRTNVSLVRKILHRPSLVTEFGNQIRPGLFPAGAVVGAGTAAGLPGPPAPPAAARSEPQLG